jgi:hypothetical protein
MPPLPEWLVLAAEQFGTTHAFRSTNRLGQITAYVSPLALVAAAWLAGWEACTAAIAAPATPPDDPTSRTTQE